jgi:hypothetical protein
MNITNGTVSRTVKPADCEARTVTLSFALDPGEDADVAIARVQELAEHHAHLRSAPVEVAPQRVQLRRPPKVSNVSQSEPTTTVELSASDPANEVVVAIQPVTDAVLKAAFMAARERRVPGDAITDLVTRHTGNKAIKSFAIPLEDSRRALILAEVNALKVEE